MRRVVVNGSIVFEILRLKGINIKFTRRSKIVNTNSVIENSMIIDSTEI